LLCVIGWYDVGRDAEGNGGGLVRGTVPKLYVNSVFVFFRGKSEFVVTRTKSLRLREEITAVYSELTKHTG
jgi:hypothetical protein